jgi:AcrR family transcriptional regulator
VGDGEDEIGHGAAFRFGIFNVNGVRIVEANVSNVNMKAESPYHHGDLRHALVEAGLGLLARDGQGGLGLREVARAVGVSPSAPYRHFKNRTALLAAVATEGFRRFGADLKKAARGVPVERHLLEQGRAYVRFALTHPALFRLMFSPEVKRSEHPALKESADTAFFSLEALAASANPQDPHATALAAWSLVHGLAQLLLDDQINRRPGQSDDALIGAVTGAFMAGLGHR